MPCCQARFREDGHSEAVPSWLILHRCLLLVLVLMHVVPGRPEFEWEGLSPWRQALLALLLIPRPVHVAHAALTSSVVGGGVRGGGTRCCSCWGVPGPQDDVYLHPNPLYMRSKPQ